MHLLKAWTDWHLIVMQIWAAFINIVKTFLKLRNSVLWHVDQYYSIRFSLLVQFNTFFTSVVLFLYEVSLHHHKSYWCTTDARSSRADLSCHAMIFKRFTNKFSCSKINFERWTNLDRFFMEGKCLPLPRVNIYSVSKIFTS